MILRSLFFKESQDRTAREAMDLCLRVLKESNKSRFDSYKVRNKVLIISHITFRDCRVHIFPTTFLEIAVCVCMNLYHPAHFAAVMVSSYSFEMLLRESFVDALQVECLVFELRPGDRKHFS